MHRRTATIRTISTLVAALAAVLVGATPAQASPAQSAVTTQASAAGTIPALFSEVRHTSITKTGGTVRERLVIYLSKRATVINVRVYTPYNHLRAARGPVNLGSLSPGWHSWTWTGYNNSGKQVPDGYYQVRGDVAFAAGGGRYGQVLGRAFVHRHYTRVT